MHESANEMWSGGEAAKISVPGHLYLAGVSSVGIKVSERVSATVYMDAELIIDADPNNNGVFQPLGESATGATTDPSLVPSSQV